MGKDKSFGGNAPRSQEFCLGFPTARMAGRNAVLRKA